MWSAETSQGFESRKIKYLLPKYTRGRGLEIGCGMEKAFPHFIGLDNGHHFGQGAADLICNADDLSLFADRSVDFVFSSHVLEHMESVGETLNEWGRVIRPGGYLCLYVPSANLYPKCGEYGANPDHKHDFYPGDIEKELNTSAYSWMIVESEERGEGDEYSLFIVAQKGYGKVVKPSGKSACVVRFGAFGDMLQAALVFPRLKEQGYHVTVMTTAVGEQILRDDPFVDDFYILDRDQVPNLELGAFWAVQKTRFDKWVQLSESIEGTLLALPGRPNHGWPHSARKMAMKLNYHEWTAALAEVPFSPCQLFYPDSSEVESARQRLSGGFNIVWALAGSSFHKFTPFLDPVIARILLEMPEATIYLVGDEFCKVLEQGWEEEERVVRLSGEISIRETLAMAQAANLVIGPETGVLNSVAFTESVSKILMMSHSSVNNLAKHFIKCQALVPVDTPCYPCHRLHYSDEHCFRDKESGAALCAQNISAAMIYDAVVKVYRYWRARK